MKTARIQIYGNQINMPVFMALFGNKCYFAHVKEKHKTT